MDSVVIISVVAIVTLGALIGLGLYLHYHQPPERETIDELVRRTMAMQMMTDEEYALRQAEGECQSVELLIRLNQLALDDQYEHLLSESRRIVRESSDMLAQIQQKRIQVQKTLPSMNRNEVEAIIAEAYQGKMRAEAQLKRTIRSKEQTMDMYQLKHNDK